MYKSRIFGHFFGFKVEGRLIHKYKEILKKLFTAEIEKNLRAFLNKRN